MLVFILLAIVAGLAVYVSMQPNQFSISRSGSISAPPAAVFAVVNDFHKWEAWSPWAKMDPNCKNTYEGAPSGEGAVVKWDGNNKVGSGMMTLTESKAPERILIDLQFFKPFKATNLATFTFAPEGAGTRVTWTMSGKNALMGKAMSLVMNCDKMVGGQFEQGLANMKAVVEQK